MYTIEEKQKAVESYIKYGKKSTKVVRDLGYPSVRAIRQWYLEYLSDEGFQPRKNRKSKYSAEQRQIALDHYFEHGCCLAHTIRELGYPSSDQMRKWIYEDCPEIKENAIKYIKNKSFCFEEKVAAVLQVSSGNKTGIGVSQELGVSRGRLYQWRDQLLGNGDDATLKTKRVKKTDENRDKLLSEIETLQQQVHQLRLEQDILKKANELLKKDQGINLDILTNPEKANLIDALKDIYALSELRNQLNIAKSTYHYHKAQLLSPEKYMELRTMMKTVFHENRGVYGYRRIHAALRHTGIVVSEKVIRRIMSEEKLIVPYKKKKRYKSYIGEITPAVPNLIKRKFHAEKPNEKWLTDITEFQIPNAKIYLSPIIDCYDGMVISWSTSTVPDAKLVNSMLKNAISKLPKGATPIIHSDRGGHYRWPGWINLMKSANLPRSMSKKGCTPDNSACEGFFGRLKNEMFYNRSWENVTPEVFIRNLDEYIHWYNERRIKISLGNRSPMEYRVAMGGVA